MIQAKGFEGEKVAVLGLARSGLAAALSLKAGGAEVLAWDDAPERRAAASAEGVPIVDLNGASFADLRALILSPGIPHTYPKPHPLAVKARASDVPILGDIELLALACPEARYVGITGTNGKSTTTALIAHILASAGQKVQVGGNLGTAALTLARLGADGIYVLEMSSYQLELIEKLAFDVAVFLNLTPDHLDRHGGMEGYIAAKRRIFNRGRKPQTAIVGVDDEPGRAIAHALAQENAWRVTRISISRQEKGGVYVVGGTLVDDTTGGAVSVIDLSQLPRLPGQHNWQNVAAAYAAVRALGVDREQVGAGIASFPGLAHRQELIATIDGIRYINDSKATNADAAAKALVCYDGIYWIAGGIAKEGGITPLAPYFPHIRHAFLIGQAADQFAGTLQGQVPFTRSRDLATAVADARRAALADGQGGVVLLSPACASFDQFPDFEVRGDAFRRIVQGLPGSRT
jgi:UDP-N-acetylmuramoylalanine--D-glutamate ligase